MTAQGGFERWIIGGALMDVGSYCVSALRLLCGEPDRVKGELVERAGVDGRGRADAARQVRSTCSTPPPSLNSKILCISGVDLAGS